MANIEMDEVNLEELKMEDQTQAQAAETTAAPVLTKKMSQKDAVFAFVVEAVEAAGLVDKNQDICLKEIKAKVTKDVRKVVRQRLFAGLKAGEIVMSKQCDDSKLKKYASGLINNWLKKDKRFN